MHIVGVFDAKNRLTALLDEVERGGEVLITRRGKPVARLVAAEVDQHRAKARQAAASLAKLGETASLEGVSIRTLIEEGRRW